MAGLFDEIEREQTQHFRPLAERMRPQHMSEVVGQEHLLAPGSPLAAFAAGKSIPSMILWGPPGTGKTTLARCLARDVDVHFEHLSAVEAGVQVLREVIGKAQRRLVGGHQTIVFVDEIHRFNKGQQDALLHAVERGDLILIGATTENPSFEVNSALLSRCQVYRLQTLSDAHIIQLIERALATDAVLATRNISTVDLPTLITLAGGDARTALNALEYAAQLAEPNDDGFRSLTSAVIQNAMQKRIARYDRAGEAHFDTISAFIKSVRGSDPDAALLYLAMMVDAGEDPTFIARRLVILASEDIGNADPSALPLAVAAFQAVERIGMPEGRIPLGQVTAYLASAPKSNASYRAIDAALAIVRASGAITIPLHLRNAATPLMKKEGYGVNYQYPHDYNQHFVHASYFPLEIPEQKIYQPSDQGSEADIGERLRRQWPERETE